MKIFENNIPGKKSKREKRRKIERRRILARETLLNVTRGEFHFSFFLFELLVFVARQTFLFERVHFSYTRVQYKRTQGSLSEPDIIMRVSRMMIHDWWSISILEKIRSQRNTALRGNGKRGSKDLLSLYIVHCNYNLYLLVIDYLYR